MTMYRLKLQSADWLPHRQNNHWLNRSSSTCTIHVELELLRTPILCTQVYNSCFGNNMLSDCIHLIVDVRSSYTEACTFKQKWLIEETNKNAPYEGFMAITRHFEVKKVSSFHLLTALCFLNYPPYIHVG